MSTALLREAMTFYETHPALRTVQKWIDGDMASLAGRICLIAGATPVPNGLRPEVGRTVSYQGWRRDVPDLACELAGVTACEARWLFHHNRTIVELRGAVKDIDDGRAISGRPYWLFTDADHRFITTDGKIVVAVMRRTVFYVQQGCWTTVHLASHAHAWRFARTTAHQLKASPYRLATFYTQRSITP